VTEGLPRLFYKREDRDEVQEAVMDLCDACWAAVAEMDDAAFAELIRTWIESSGEDQADCDIEVCRADTAEEAAKLARLERWADWFLTLRDRWADFAAAYRESVAAGHAIPGVMVEVEGDIEHDEDLRVWSGPVDLTGGVKVEKGHSYWQRHGVTGALERLPKDHFPVMIFNDDKSLFVMRSRPIPAN
jgi:hypothetical protein